MQENADVRLWALLAENWCLDVGTEGVRTMSRSSVYVPDLDAVAWKPLSEVLPDYPQASLDALRAEAKLMNQDPDTGAFTMVVKLPPGGGDAAIGSHSSDQEMFLL